MVLHISAFERKHGFIAGALFILLAVLVKNKTYVGEEKPVYSPRLSPVQSTEKLRNHSKTFDVPQVVKVTDGVFLAIGYTLANMIMIEGKYSLSSLS